MIKLSDFIAKYLKEKYNVQHFFMVSGGGAMHLNNSLGNFIPYICNHHEQACSIAAEGYARVNQTLAVVNVTTGPGGLNCLNGVFGQWTDSVPVLYISGQVKYTTMMDSCKEVPLRQLGDQEVDIISVVKPLTKYAVTIYEPNEIKYHIDKAIHEATTGRFGPVWLNIPMNVQGAIIDESELKEFVINTAPKQTHLSQEMSESKKYISEVTKKLKHAKKPLIIAGHGIRLSKQTEKFYKLIEKLNIPVVTTFNGMDLLENNNHLFIGRIGTIGQRAGNFALQNADLLLELGTRNNIRQVSYNWENFGKNAYKIVVDIDKAELEKPLVKPDLAINMDLADFIPALLNELGITTHPQVTSEQIESSPLEGEDVRRTGEGYKESHRIYLPYMQTLARNLRKEQTPQEIKLWNILRNSQTGYKFRRQHQFDNKYIADFVCLEKHLIIELDGSQHLESFNDTQRTFYLNTLGYDVIRFWNNEVESNLEDCYEVILQELNTPHPSPLPQGAREQENNHNHYLSENDTQSFLSAESQVAMGAESCPSELVLESLDNKWLEFCQNLKEKYSFENEDSYIQQEKKPLNPYYFVRKLTENLKENDIFVMGNGSACVCTYQVGVVKNNQRFILNSGNAAMGYDLPCAIGAYIGSKRRTICLTGDGSIMMNLQELETISHNKLPIKIFILNNSGYSSIRQTQKNFFNGNMTGSGIDSGVGMPNWEILTKGFGLEYQKIANCKNIDKRIQDVLNYEKGIVCEVILEQDYSFCPKLSAKKLGDGTMISPSLEDMSPFLSKEEIEENGI